MSTETTSEIENLRGLRRLNVLNNEGLEILENLEIELEESK